MENCTLNWLFKLIQSYNILAKMANTKTGQDPTQKGVGTWNSRGKSLSMGVNPFYSEGWVI